MPKCTICGCTAIDHKYPKRIIYIQNNIPTYQDITYIQFTCGHFINKGKYTPEFVVWIKEYKGTVREIEEDLKELKVRFSRSSISTLKTGQTNK